MIDIGESLGYACLLTLGQKTITMEYEYGFSSVGSNTITQLLIAYMKEKSNHPLFNNPKLVNELIPIINKEKRLLATKELSTFTISLQMDDEDDDFEIMIDIADFVYYCEKNHYFSQIQSCLSSMRNVLSFFLMILHL